MTLAEKLSQVTWGGKDYDCYDGQMFWSLIGAAMQSNAASHAADTQANAANHAADLQHQDAQAALDFNKQQYATAQQQISPFLKVGTAGAANLAYQLGILPPSSSTNGAVPAATQSKLRSNTGVDGLPPGSTVSSFVPGHTMASQFGFDGNSDVPMGGSRFADSLDRGAQPVIDGSGGGTLDASGNPVPADSGGGTVDLNSLVNPSLGAPGSLLQDFGEKFQAPDNITEQNDPGYKERLARGQDAIQRSAASRGGLLTGGTAKDLNDWTQNTASNEYSNVYNRAFNDYSTRYNVFKQNQADRYNKLAATSGAGQVAAGQLAQLGSNSANTNSNILLTSGQQIGQNINNAAAARASGYIGGANAWSGALNGVGNNLTSLYLLSQTQ